MNKIVTSKGAVAIVSREDYRFLATLTWYRDRKGYFIACSSRLHGQRMYRIIAERSGADISHQIDHKNRNKADNRRCNLRPATNGRNRANSKRNVNNASGFKGVHLRKKPTRHSSRKVRSDRMGNRWVAQINANGKKIHLGYFSTAQAAYDRYKKAALTYFGEFANP